jgi:hypothetical protein
VLIALKARDELHYLSGEDRHYDSEDWGSAASVRRVLPNVHDTKEENGPRCYPGFTNGDSPPPAIQGSLVCVHGYCTILPRSVQNIQYQAWWSVIHRANGFWLTKHTGVNYKPSLISDLFWKPFDARFSDLLDRLRCHQEVFRCEMQLEESKYLDHQNDKRIQQSELDGQVLRQIQQQAEDLRQLSDQLESKILSELAAFEHKIHKTINENNRKELERKEAAVMSK